MNPPNHAATRRPSSRAISFDGITGSNHDIKLGDRVGVMVNDETRVGLVKYIGRYDAKPSSGIWVGLKLNVPGLYSGS
jgi:hypothetical protein